MNRIILTALALGISVFSFSQNNNTQPASLTNNYSGNHSDHNHDEFRSGVAIQQGVANANNNLNPTLSTGQHTCKTFELNQQHYLERGLQNEFNADYLQHAEGISTTPTPKTSGVNEISVIFHVVHDAGDALGNGTNVSNADIITVYNDLVEDFLLQNANAANARGEFGFVPADANINFCLATNDPFGTPLTEVGVIRVPTSEDWYDSDNGEENKMKSASTGGSEIWDRNDYLNVWICDISNGAGSGTAGYAYRPSPSFLPSSGIDGIVLDYNLGVNNENVLTHEVGHYLGLDHTWGGSGGCTNDDGFGDTPNTTGPSFDYPGSCSGSQQTCGATETQYENYMDYANCTVMFTQEQADYMLSILQGIRGSLLLSPGCDPVDAPPVVDFTADIGDPIIIPVGASVNFFSLATNSPTSWTWDFAGGAPASTDENPNVAFNSLGTFTVTHTATNAFGTGSETKTNHVQVVAAASGIACDTLRNYDPYADALIYTWLPPSAGYISGNSYFDGVGDIPEWAEFYTSSQATSVRALEFFPARVSDGGGSVIFKVYANAAGEPGAVLASESVLLADLTELTWNNIVFTTPSTNLTTFWVGYELSYNSVDTFAMVVDDTPATNELFVDYPGFGWTNAYTGGTYAGFMDVLTSNGPDPVASFTATDNEVCVGGDITVNGSGSTNTGEYRWYHTDDPYIPPVIYDFSTNAGHTFNFPSVGAYQIFMFAHGSCLSDGLYLPITINPPATGTINSTSTTCGMNNGSITISAPSGGDGVSYQYSIDGVNWSTTNTFNNLPSGSYDVWITTDGDNCETMYTVVIGSSAEFVGGVSSNTSICPGDNATVTASGGISYVWTDGAAVVGTNASEIVTPSTTTQFACLVTDASGCQSTVYTTVTVNPLPALPVISAGGSTTICSGSSVDLTSSYPTGNVWSTTETSTTITASTAGFYTVTHTDGNGCSSTSNSMEVIVTPGPSISSGTVNGPVTCATQTGSIEITGVATGDISWTGTTSGSATGQTLPYTITGLGAGSYNITMTDGSGCVSNIITEALSDPTPPTTPTITPGGATTFCDGGSVILTSSYGSGNTWSNASTNNSVTISATQTLTVTYTDGSGCSSTSAPISVVVNPNPSTPTVTPSGATTFCDGGSVDLSSSQGTGNSWSTTETSQTITVNSSGNYSVTYTDVNGCSATSANVSVTVNALPTTPTISASGPITFCDGGSVTLTASNASGNTWSNSATTQDITVTSTGSFNVTYTDINGCSSTSANTDVTVNGLPNVNAGSDIIECEGNDIILQGSGADTYAWDNGVSDGVAFTPTLGSTDYTVTGTDLNGCVNTDMVNVTINALPTVTLDPISISCVYDAAFTLGGESPTGGTFSGNGVSGGQFDPNTAGVGTHTITYTYTDGSGCENTATTDIEVDACIGLDEEFIPELNVFPNPTNGELTIELIGDFNYEITDARGRVVSKGFEVNSTTVDLQMYETGVYFINVYSDKVKEVVRIIKN